MSFIPQEILEYAEKHSEKEPKVLQELRRETWQKVLAPRMLSGHIQGRFLAMISKIVCPESILEIGTYTGYATICLAEGLVENGLIHTVDNNEELLEIQEKYFLKAGYKKQILQYTGDALHIIPHINQKFDLVFIDADKANYSSYFDAVIENMKTGGIILVDNVLWSGKVIHIPNENDIDTKAIIAFNEKVRSDKRVKSLLLPIRDGLSMLRKL